MRSAIIPLFLYENSEFFIQIELITQQAFSYENNFYVKNRNFC